MSKYVLLLLAIPFFSHAADQSHQPKKVTFFVEKRTANTAQAAKSFQPIERVALLMITGETFLDLEKRLAQKYGREVKLIKIPRRLGNSFAIATFDKPNAQLMSTQLSDFPLSGTIWAAVH